MIRSVMCALFVLALSVNVVLADRPIVAKPAPVAEDAIRAADTKPMECEFVKFDAKSHELVVKCEGKEKTFKCTEKVKCTSDTGDMMKLADIKAGAKLKIWVEKDAVTKIECCK